VSIQTDQLQAGQIWAATPQDGKLACHESRRNPQNPPSHYNPNNTNSQPEQKKSSPQEFRFTLNRAVFYIP